MELVLPRLAPDLIPTGATKPGLHQKPRLYHNRDGLTELNFGYNAQVGARNCWVGADSEQMDAISPHAHAPST